MGAKIGRSLHGKLKVKQRKEALAAWRDPEAIVGRVLLATGRYVGEGFDDPLLDTLVMASPVSWRGTLVQYVGRLTRESPGKRDIVVYDYLDAEVAVLRRMFERRKAGYRSLGFGAEVLTGRDFACAQKGITTLAASNQ